MTYKTIEFSHQDGVAVIALNRPEKRNALNDALKSELAQAIAEVKRTEAIRALVLTGNGGCFCAGGDLVAGPDRDTPVEDGARLIRDIHTWFRELMNLEKPVIAAVDGIAFGAGFNLALAADFVLATPQASFSQVFCRVGLIPDLYGLYLLPRMVGLARAKELIFSGRVITTEEAHALGLVYAIRDPASLREEAVRFAARFTTASPLAFGLAKKILNQAHNLDEATMSELEISAQAACMKTDYYHDAVARFRARQPALFPWDDPKPE